jgi:hypothetical protein
MRGGLRKRCDRGQERQDNWTQPTMTAKHIESVVARPGTVYGAGA